MPYIGMIIKKIIDVDIININVNSYSCWMIKKICSHIANRKFKFLKNNIL